MQWSVFLNSGSLSSSVRRAVWQFQICAQIGMTEQRQPPNQPPHSWQVVSAFLPTTKQWQKVPTAHLKIFRSENETKKVHHLMFRARIFKISRWNKCFVQQSPASRFGAPVTEAGGPLRTGFETSGHVERTLEVDRIGGWQCVRDCENNRIAVVNLLKGSVECYSDFRYFI